SSRRCWSCRPARSAARRSRRGRSSRARPAGRARTQPQTFGSDDASWKGPLWSCSDLSCPIRRSVKGRRRGFTKALKHHLLGKDGALAETVEPVRREVDRGLLLEELVSNRTSDRRGLHEAVA